MSTSAIAYRIPQFINLNLQLSYLFGSYQWHRLFIALSSADDLLYIAVIRLYCSVNNSAQDNVVGVGMCAIYHLWGDGQTKIHLGRVQVVWGFSFPLLCLLVFLCPDLS